MIPYDTLLDAARRHFNRAAHSQNFTLAARHLALECERQAEAELAAFNEGRPMRTLCNLNPPHIHRPAAPAWREEDDTEPLRTAA